MATKMHALEIGHINLLPVLRSHLKFTTNVILYLVLYHKGKEIYKNNGKWDI